MVLPFLAAAAVATYYPYHSTLIVGPGRLYYPFEKLTCDTFRFTTDACTCDTVIDGAHLLLANGRCASGDRVQPFQSAVVSAVGVYQTVRSPCIIDLKGAASIRTYVGLIAQSAFYTSRGDNLRRDFAYSLLEPKFDTGNDHLYEGFAIDRMREAGWYDRSWFGAQAFCAHPDRDKLGLVGYLATSTGEAEENWIAANLDGFGWLGGADMEEGKWRWVTGPEGCPPYPDSPAFVGHRSMCNIGVPRQGSRYHRCVPGPAAPDCYGGTLFWSLVFRPAQCNLPATGITETYANFKSPEPNNCGGANENVLHHYGAGRGWNDDANIGFYPIRSFVCEWGHVGELCLDKFNLYSRSWLVYVLDECNNPCTTCAYDTCTGFRQICRDPNQRVTSDWYCSCRSPATGTAVAATASCPYDECMGDGGRTCHAAGQSCTDPVQDATSLGDFVCRCAAPETAEAVGEAATCGADECEDGDGRTLCVDVGQLCEDPDPTQGSMGDFVCSCAPPQNGSAVGGAATCTLDECVHGEGRAFCTDRNQTCHDPDTLATVRGDFTCTCPLPQNGTAVGQTATCTLDECAAGEGSATCNDQTCSDPDTSVPPAQDFTCTCMAPDEGSAVGAYATCGVDECRGVAEGGLDCGVGQTCIEPDLRVSGDAYCKCDPPADATKVGGPAACDYNECADHSGVCAAENQVCEDPNLRATGDWVCRCVAPQYSTPAAGVPGQQRPAACRDPDGDCVKFGHICHDAGQLCDPGADPIDSVFSCTCTPPSRGDPAANTTASCTLEECSERCASCQKTDAHPTGICSGQTCEDPDTSPTATHNWICVCKAPYAGRGLAQPAACTINECEATCSHCAGRTCADASQACIEPDVSIAADWGCACRAPQRGTGVGAAATCELNECDANEAVCVGGGQTCEDVNQDPAATGDWVCVCPAPSTTRATAAVAECEVDECLGGDAQRTCAAVDQDCQDVDTRATGTWICVCRAPLVGRALRARAACTFDECTATCDSCADSGAGNVCSNAGQACEDPDHAAAARSDWVCLCVPPSGTASAVGVAVAACPERNECVHESTAVLAGRHAPRYTRSGCLCRYAWTLTCAAGTACAGPGSVDGGPCETACCNPDGEANGDWCFIEDHPYNDAKAGCNPGSNAGFGSYADMWETCLPKGVPPSSGGLTPPVRREHIPGVADEQTNICTDAAQRCVDPSSADDDWYCECVHPLTGEPAQGPQQPTTCELDECNEHGATCTSQAPSQTCTDMNRDVDSTGDWACECAVGPRTRATAAAVSECELDECAELCNTCAFNGTHTACEAAGQACEDPVKSTRRDALGDWRCVCRAPLTGSVVGGVAQCRLDECTAICDTCAIRTGMSENVCEAEGQRCIDRDTSPGAYADWECYCPPPSTSKAVVTPATCLVDECVNAGCPYEQLCTDPDHAVADDWYCECVAPYHGRRTGAPAECELDECADEDTCTRAGQACVDDDTTAPDTWYCRCVEPEHGADAVMAAAMCMKASECEGNTVCSDAGQVCYDDLDQPTVTDNWECRCIAPFHGDPGRGVPAVCRIDECAEACATCQRAATDDEGTCTAHGQGCEDRTDTGLSDWNCVCTHPLEGTPAMGFPASCTLDECAADCDTCEKDVCAAAGQTCKDPDTKERAVGDWQCQCSGNSTNAATGRPVPVCLHNECGDNVPSATCSDAVPPQTCVDPDPAVDGNWECHCRAPATGARAGGAADGCDTFNECTAVCDHCAATNASGSVCAQHGQGCVDPDFASPGDWACECAPPSTGARVGDAVPAAVCVLDECTAVCDTCADRGGGVNVCEGEGQTCGDPTTNLAGTSDWRCTCGAPLGFISATAAAAACEFNECTQRRPGDAAPPGEACRRAGQVCSDAYPSTVGDFLCSCVTPRSGSHTGAPAACTLNECDIDANRRTCTDAVSAGYGPQECVDNDVAHAGDWQCVCPAPATGRAAARPASCGLDECTTPGTAAQCESATPPQACVDADTQTPNNWECRCRPPASGTAVAAGASCILDECKGTCAACENKACADQGQDCRDPDTSFASTGDWVCICRKPYEGERVGGAVAACAVDECALADSRAVCEGAGQKCVDADKRLRHDFECQCYAPALGSAVGRAAACEIDECGEHGSVCSAAGQACRDTDRAEDAIGDWQCECVPPAEAVDGPGIMTPADCRSTGECGSAAVAEVCTSEGQTCRDPDPSPGSIGDWLCECVAPAQGGSAVASPAACTLDECAAQCASCEAGACRRAGQQCVDEDTAPRGRGLGSWQCRCSPPWVGTATRQPAACTLDECDVYGGNCAADGQDCADEDRTAEGTWQCRCRLPARGVMTGAAATCTLDECEDSGGWCTAAGQTCEDPNHAVDARGDWECVCPPPSAQRGREGAVAECPWDECDMYAGVCEAEGQACADPDPTTAGDWSCACVAPAIGQQVMGVAECRLDECTSVAPGSATPSPGAQNVCEAEGQTCEDADVSAKSRRDWTCTCAPPSTRSALGTPAVCAVDECAGEATRVRCTSVGQDCVDNDWGTLDSWTCRCRAPSEGIGQQGPAGSCNIDECADHDVCSDIGQQCQDPDTSSESLDDWVCVCPNDASIAVRGAPADCPSPEGSECRIFANKDVCTTAGQACVDPDPAVAMDWHCGCVPPARPGQQLMGPAKCVLDECTADCSGCAGDLCADADQDCMDPDKDAHVRHDWMCVCRAPAAGRGVTQQATCQLNECAAQCVTCADTGGGEHACAAAGQGCEDADVDARSVNDWVCVCPPPSAGRRQGAPAVCELNECDTVGNIECRDQSCVDASHDPSVTNDWRCVCPAPAVGEAVLRRAVCTVNECADANSAETCTRAGQVCVDADTAVDARGDWECRCRETSQRAVMEPAVCELNECTEICRTCADRGAGDVCAAADPPQACEDPTPAAGDWLCVCEGGAPAATGGPARCPVDECAGDTVCAVAGQRCVDPDIMTRYNWRCECLAPAVGAPAEGGAAPSCEVDECGVYSDVCASAAPPQSCEDPSPAEMDWMCNCPQGTGGAPGTQAAAVSCTYTSPECDEYGRICATAGQLCIDPDAARTGDWRCACAPPLTGASRAGAPASCTLDECTATCTSCAGRACETAGQACVDPSLAPEDTGDWVCECRSPATGRRQGAVSTCETDECTIDGGANMRVCMRVGQTCVDADRLAAGTWSCVCAAPAVGGATARAAECRVDECGIADNRDVCVGAGQACKDPTLAAASRDDWVCECVDEQLGPRWGVRAPATCMQNGWCATGGRVCRDAGQVCVPTDGGEGYCRCVAPFVGAEALGRPAACEVDECATPCATCAGTVCAVRGQLCEDPDQTVLDNWLCVCPRDTTIRNIGVPATCMRDECKGNTLCLNAGQACVDPDPSLLDDWYCMCPAPQTGRRVGGVAGCTMNECALHEGVCAASAQTCYDPTPAEGDWRCACVAPRVGEREGAAATCTHSATDECGAVEIEMICTGRGQACVDTDPSPGTWECRCVPPQAGGAGRRAPAACTLDECGAVCASCAQRPGSSQGVCAAAAQTCTDPDTEPTELGDWVCLCVAPLVGRAPAARAVCGRDECGVRENSETCALQRDVDGHVMQACVDPDIATSDDWECHCTPPHVGPPTTAAPARCGYDECRADIGVAVCAARGQMCMDPNQQARGNWECRCVQGTGVAVGAVATCTYDAGNECSNVAIAALCYAAGQACEDPDTGVAGDWRCVCLPPARGSAIAAAAECTLDECIETCKTCEGGACGRDQECEDGDTLLESVSDWQCVCQAPMAGTAVGARAVCGVDECSLLEVRVLCGGGDEACIDPLLSRLGDWVCMCMNGSPARAVAGPVLCAFDECTVASTRGVCAAASQVCVDADPFALGTWECVCSDGRRSATAPVESCTTRGSPLDECSIALCGAATAGAPCPRELCAAAGQVCVDDAADPTVLGNWVCACDSPEALTRVGAPVEDCGSIAGAGATGSRADDDCSFLECHWWLLLLLLLVCCGGMLVMGGLHLRKAAGVQDDTVWLPEDEADGTQEREQELVDAAAPALDTSFAGMKYGIANASGALGSTTVSLLANEEGPGSARLSRPSSLTSLSPSEVSRGLGSLLVTSRTRV